MKCIFFWGLFLFPCLAFAQLNGEEVCILMSKSESVESRIVPDIIDEMEEHYGKVAKRISELGGLDKHLPKNWLKQSLYMAMADCFAEGRYVMHNSELANHFLLLARDYGSKQAAHTVASLQLFQSDDPQDHKEGFDYLESEYLSGSAYSGGKLGWAYQRGLAVEPNLEKAIELYEHAAKSGMTYWQFLLAHAYEQGYLGLNKDLQKSQYWLEYELKAHRDHYECWVASYYRNGIFPTYEKKEAHYQSICDKAKRHSQSKK